MEAIKLIQWLADYFQRLTREGQKQKSLVIAGLFMIRNTSHAQYLAAPISKALTGGRGVLK